MANENESVGVILTENQKVQKNIYVEDYTKKFDDSNIFETPTLLESMSGEPITPILNEEFVEAYFMLERLSNNVANQLSEFKTIIKQYVETHNTGSFESNGMAVKYTNATTSTTIDTAKLKSTYPDIAADCSKVSSRASSISIKESGN